MRVLIATDKFAGTLSAAEAGRAIAEGWRRTAPDDTVTVAPMADGGPGFIDVLAAAGEGRLQAVTVRGPLGEPVPAVVLLDGETGYVESAQACGLHLTEESARSPWTASTYGVGQAIGAAIDAGARRIVVGLGGSATADGGAGLLAALGARADVALDAGPRGLDGITSVDLSAVTERMAGVELVAAADVQTPLLGMFGATKVFGPQKGLGDEDILAVDRILDRYVDAVCGTTPAERRTADEHGAGAAGGLGFALLMLGATVRSGIELVADAVGLYEAAATHDLVVTGEGAFDYSSRAGKVVHGVAQVAQQAARPCVVIAGRVDVGSREMRALGIESAYSVVDHAGEEAAFAAPAEQLSALAARVARTWSTRWR